jgi:hypothetical protein
MIWRRVGLVAIKASHSAIFFALAGALVDFFWSGVRGRSDRRAALAGIAVSAEALIFAANGFRCPLTSIAEDLGAESGSVSDIYLPRPIGENLPYITGPVFAIGGLLHARNLWARTTDKEAA